jgi:FkbM family methyltransferase
MARIINKVLRKLGYEIKPYPTGDLLRRLKLIKNFNIDLILDVGASVGEYALIMRNLGYKGRIVSFEPMKRSYSSLAKNSSKDVNWDAYNYALGSENKKDIINIAGNFDSSSILKINDLHLNAANQCATIGQEEISIKKLDDVFTEIHKEERNIFMKLDTQGYEKFVFEGAQNILNSITGIQIELSINPLYDGSEDFLSIITYLKSFGFELFSVEPGFCDKKTGRLMQFDGVFIKNIK